MDRDPVFDLGKYLEQRVRVRFAGGREVEGRLKGYDKLDNLVLDECIEYLRDPEDPMKVTEKTRQLGLVICRGPQVTLISPDSIEAIANPFLEAEEES